MNILIIICISLSFISSFAACPLWIKQAKKHGLTGLDVHKTGKKQVAELGGVPIIFGFIVGILSYIALDVFYFTQKYNVEINMRVLSVMAGVVAILIATIIGLIDDILGWKIGLRQWQKPLLMFIAALPIITINAGSSIMNLPLIGQINLGIIYPLLVIPLAISGAANAFNMIAGYNGLEAGMGIIIISTLSYISWSMGKSARVAVFGMCMVAALLAFYLFNKYPAQVFPGDTMTYAVGTLIAVMAIMGDMEKAALIMFIPYFIELLLKARGRFQKQSFAKVLPDKSLVNQYSKVYGIEHIAVVLLNRLKSKASEQKVVGLILLWEFLLASSVIVLYT